MSMFEINQNFEIEEEIRTLVEKVENAKSDFDCYSALMKELFLRTSAEN